MRKAEAPAPTPAPPARNRPGCTNSTRATTAAASTAANPAGHDRSAQAGAHPAQLRQSQPDRRRCHSAGRSTGSSQIAMPATIRPAARWRSAGHGHRRPGSLRHHGRRLRPLSPQNPRRYQRNWIPLIPEEARPPLNKQGETLIRFTILPDGRISPADGMNLDGPSQRRRHRPRLLGRHHRRRAVSATCPPTSRAHISNFASTSSRTSPFRTRLTHPAISNCAALSKLMSRPTCSTNNTAAD